MKFPQREERKRAANSDYLLIMKTINDIKAILYDVNETDNEVISAFSNLKGPLFVPFNGEEELGNNIEKYKNQGFNSKEVVILKSFKGRFYQLCPGSPGVTCCNYKVINTCFNCIYNCTYCFLNLYLNSFGIIQFVNIKDLENELDDFLNTMDRNFVYRIGSGEFTDSLMIDDITGMGERLINKFSGIKNCMLELKTKSNNVDHLLNINYKGNTVLAWSMNTQRNIIKYEQDTASFEERVESAGRACDANYFIAFHFDPIIIYNDWEKDYKYIIKVIFQKVKADKIVWISLGGFRYSPAFKDILRNKFVDEELTTEEMFPGIDGKYRYLKNKRIDIYRTIIRYIHEFTDKPFIYLCMESRDVWNSVFNRYYDSSQLLEKDFSEYLKKTFL